MSAPDAQEKVRGQQAAGLGGDRSHSVSVKQDCCYCTGEYGAVVWVAVTCILMRKTHIVYIEQRLRERGERVRVRGLEQKAAKLAWCLVFFFFFVLSFSKKPERLFDVALCFFRSSFSKKHEKP